MVAAEIKELVALRSIPSVIDWLDERFVVRRRGQEIFGTSIKVEQRISGMAIIEQGLQR
jgi:hypothetical protein